MIIRERATIVKVAVGLLLWIFASSYFFLNHQ
jgi:hypothetical protein